MKYKVPSNVVRASQLLFRTLVSRLDGSSEVGRRVGESRQQIYNFETYGYIPLKKVYSIAKDLNLQVWHLSFYKLVEIHGNDAPHFENLVQDLDILTTEDKARILKAYKK